MPDIFAVASSIVARSAAPGILIAAIHVTPSQEDVSHSITGWYSSGGCIL